MNEFTRLAISKGEEMTTYQTAALFSSIIISGAVILVLFWSLVHWLLLRRARYEDEACRRRLLTIEVAEACGRIQAVNDFYRETVEAAETVEVADTTPSGSGESTPAASTPAECVAVECVAVERPVLALPLPIMVGRDGRA